MTKTAKTTTDKTAETTAGDATGYFASIRETIDAVQSKIEVPAAARDLVKNTAATARERAEDVRAGAEKATYGVEKFAVSLIGGYANLARGLVDMAHANVQLGLETVEKVAGAKSVNEAVQIQADYAREYARANFERVKEAAEAARTTVMDGAKNAQADLSSLYSVGQKKAA